MRNVPPPQRTHHKITLRILIHQTITLKTLAPLKIIEQTVNVEALMTAAQADNLTLIQAAL